MEPVAAPLPPQLDFTFSPIVFGDEVPVGGYAHLTVKQDGSYVFSGHFHDSGATAYDMSLVYALKDIRNQAYSFTHTGHVAGTFESGSRDDDWNETGTNAAIAGNWPFLVPGTSVATASANLDIAALGSSVVSALGVVVKVIGIVGKALASGQGGGDAGGDDDGDG